MRTLWLLLVASTAHAEHVDPDAWYPRLTAGAGIGYRSGDLATVRPTGASLTVHGAVKVGPALFVDAGYELAPASVGGVAITTQSAVVGVRSALMSFGERPSSFNGDMFVTGGVAREWNRWDGGGLARNVVVLGVGVTLLLPHERIDRHLRFGVRMLLGRAPDPGKRPAACDGPCDTPTATAPYDLGFVMEVSCQLGR